MKRKMLAILGIVALLSSLSLGVLPAGSAKLTHQAAVVPLLPEAKERIKAAGKSSPELLFPTGLNKGRRFSAPDGTPLGALTVPDTLKALVILVEFSDTNLTYDQPIFNDLILGETYDPPGNEVTLPGGTVVHGPTDRTLQNYFGEVSFGEVSMTGSIVGWVPVGHPYDYYCNSTDPNWWGFGQYPNNVQGLVEDAVHAADGSVNFKDFDTDGDGIVENLFIVHTGSGAEWTGQYDVIWSHSWDMTTDDFGTPIPEVSVDGVRIMDYSMEPEYGGYPIGPKGVVSNPFPPTVGVYAHEFGHVLGLPDEYDYGYESEGTGRWSVMSGGSWNRYPNYVNFSGNSPAHPSAWGKYRLGFVDPILVPPTGLVHQTLLPIEEEPIVYRIDVPFSNGTEYFLAENRQQIGFDQSLGRMGASAHGLLIYHVDENVLQAAYWRPEEAECWHMNNANCTKVNPANGQTHYGISLEQADGRFELEKGKNVGDAGDPFPGLLRNRTFNATTTPNSSSFYFWSGFSPVPGTSGVVVTNIRENDGTITADFRYDGQGRW